jgi:hypothetical protein
MAHAWPNLLKPSIGITCCRKTSKCQRIFLLVYVRGHELLDPGRLRVVGPLQLYLKDSVREAVDVSGRERFLGKEPLARPVHVLPTREQVSDNATILLARRGCDTNKMESGRGGRAKRETKVWM